MMQALVFSLALIAVLSGCRSTGPSTYEQVTYQSSQTDKYWSFRGPVRAVSSFVDAPKNDADVADVSGEPSFQIQGTVGYRPTFFKMKLASGRVVFMDTKNFIEGDYIPAGYRDPDAAQKSAAISTAIQNAEKTEEEKREKQASLIAAELINILDHAGIQIGTSLWLRHPIGKTTGLTEVQYEGIKLIDPLRVMHSAPENYVVYLLGTTNAGDPVELKLPSQQIIRTSAASIVSFTFFTKKPAELKTWSKSVLKAIAARSIFIGMTYSQVTTSIGIPSKINTLTGSWGTQEQLVYAPYGGYVYIRNGRVYAIQD